MTGWRKKSDRRNSRCRAKKRFRSEEQDLTVNPAFNVTDEAVSAEYQAAYRSTRSLYYRERPTFEKIIERIREFATKL